MQILLKKILTHSVFMIFEILSRRWVKYQSRKIIYTPKFQFLSCEASTKQLSQQDMKRGWCKEQCLAPLKVCYYKSYLFVWKQFSVAHKVPDELVVEIQCIFHFKHTEFEVLDHVPFIFSLTNKSIVIFQITYFYIYIFCGVN